MKSQTSESQSKVPITSGDTSFRSARMILTDYFNIGQKKNTSRASLKIPSFFYTLTLYTKNKKTLNFKLSV
jgi:carbon starvation protein CstA